MELLSKLGIDWRLLIAQLINFAILIFVLYKFVYHPILNLLEKRSAMIAKGIDDAKKSEEVLKNITETEIEKMKETEQKIGKMLLSAKTDAENLKKGILAEAQKQGDDLLKRASLQIAEEKEKMISEAKSEVTNYAFQIAAKILEKEFSQENQQKLVHALAKEMPAA